MCPLLIQDATQDPRFAGHPAVRLGLTRYLAVPICDPRGAAIGTLCIMDDHSRETLAERDIRFLSLLAMRVSTELERERTTQERIAQERATQARLAELNAQLMEAAEARKRFVTTVIHDLRQPISALRTMLHVLAQESDPSEQANCQEMLSERLVALGRMVDELMQFGEIEAHGTPSHLEEVEMEPLLTQCVGEFLPDAECRDLRVTLDLDPGLREVRTDPRKLCRILRNVLSNAIKFTAESGLHPAPTASPAHGTIIVRTRAEKATWVLQVEDTGVGFGEAAYAQIFDDYYRGPEARNSETRSGSPRGRGLGLAIVRRSCADLDGEITVRSKPGEGACFTFRFPRKLATS